MITTINPANGQPIESYPLMAQHDIETLIQTMHTVQSQWSQTLISQRKTCLIQLAEALTAHKAMAAALITREMGKPITQALGEIDKCARLCEYYAEQGEALLKPELIQTEYYKSYRAFEPLGIIFAIMPWNYPFWQVMRFAVPNLMAGNAGLLKHAPNSTGTALFIEQLMEQAGFPAGLFRSLVMDVSLAPYVIRHPFVQAVTLTGSGKAGKSVASQAGAALKKVVLELGGSDPYVILEDANLEQAAEQCVQSRLNNTGQVCIAAKRIIVVEKVYKAFETLILEKVKTYAMGNPEDPATRLGPMAREDLRATLHDQVQRCIAHGAHCAVGGSLPTGPGFYYPATVLTHLTADSPAFKEELFGPVLCLVMAKNEQEAISLANDTRFGLAGAIFTRDLEKGETLARKSIHAGTCAVNTLVSSDPRLPFGGTRQSGFGRELSVEGMREFVNIKTIIVAQS